MTGILVDRIDRAHLIESMKKARLRVDEELTTEQLSVQLWGFFQGLGGKVLQCDDCKGYSPAAGWDDCPYCIEPDEDVPDDESDEEVRAESVAEKASGPKAVVPAETAKPKHEEKTMTTTVEEPKNGAANGKTLAKYDEKDLDRAVEDVQKLKSAGAMAMWHLGRKVREIYDAQLWRQRTGDGGKPRYKSVDAFFHSELGMTPQNAYKLMDISRAFTEKQVATFGTKKLGLLLEAPKEAQAAIQEKIEKGAKVREVEKDVRAANKGRTAASRPDRSGKMRGGGGSKAGRKGSSNITVANILGTQTVKLFKKATVGKGVDQKDWQRASHISDVPVGTEELINGVVRKYTLMASGGGEWVLKIETKREE